MSINRVARTLGLTPMALYTYFAGRNELLQAVSARLLENLVIEIPANAGWQERIDCWARGMRAHFLRFPYLMHILRWEGHISAAWAQQMLLVFEALAQAGFRGRALAQAAVWIFYSIMGAIHAEVAEIRSGYRFSASDIAQFNPQERAWLTTFHGYADEKNYRNEAFDYHLAQLIDGIAARIPGSSVRIRSGARRRRP